MRRLIGTAALLLFTIVMVNLHTHRQVEIVVRSFDHVKISGRGGSATVERVYADQGRYRLPRGRSLGFHDDPIEMKDILVTGCRYTVLLSHEPQNYSTVLGGIRWAWKGSTEIDDGTISRVVSADGCSRKS